jgi:hypothetical protein
LFLVYLVYIDVVVHCGMIRGGLGIIDLMGRLMGFLISVFCYVDDQGVPNVIHVESCVVHALHLLHV